MSSQPHRAVKINVPSYDGNKERWQAWRTQCEAKLLADGPLFVDEYRKILFIFSKLEGKAALTIAPRFTYGTCPWPTATAFLDHLENTFGSKNPRGDAWNALAKLKMKHGGFDEYVREFQRLITIVGDNDSLSINHRFKCGLTRDLARLIIGRVRDMQNFDL